MKDIVAIDPGMETGFVLAEYNDDEPITIRRAWQTQGGLDGMMESLWNLDIGLSVQTFVFEKFRTSPRVYKSDEVEALRIEGAVRLLRPDVVMQYNGAMLLAGTDHGSPGKNKTAADNVLRAMGLWHTGKMIGAKDANDVNSAMKHLVAYLRGIGHAPTMEALRHVL